MLSDTSFLTQLHPGEDYISPSGRKYETVVCRCELCGKIKTVTLIIKRSDLIIIPIL